MLLFLNIATYGGSNDFLFLRTSIFKPLQLEVSFEMINDLSCWGDNLSEFVASCNLTSEMPQSFAYLRDFSTFVVAIYNYGRLEGYSRSSGKIGGFRARFV
jgi:hypothetical protein